MAYDVYHTWPHDGNQSGCPSSPLTLEYNRIPTWTPDAEAELNSSFVLLLQLEFILGDVLHLSSSLTLIL